MSESQISQSLEKFGKALSRLDAALALPEENPDNRDIVILRFVFVYETAWKALKHCLSHEKIPAGYPKEVLKAAYKAQWIKDEMAWLTLLDDRNLVAHTYNEATACKVYEDVKRFTPEFHRTYLFLKEKFPG